MMTIVLYLHGLCAGVGPGPGAGAGAGQADQGEGEPVCEECSQARNLIHCIDASIQVDIFSIQIRFKGQKLLNTILYCLN